MAEQHESGVLDTSVVIDLEHLDETRLPVKAAVATATLAELGAGLHTARDPVERAARMFRLQVVEANLEPLPFDPAAARHYGQLIAVVLAAGQNPRPRRLDLMIAATAHASDLPLYTRNPRDFQTLRGSMTIVAV
jgi:predicted nucleic acid-binding protein